MRQKFSTAFNWVSLGLYGVNEILQKLHIISREMVRQNHPDPLPSAYDLMPFGGEFIRAYASSFSGAVAMAFVAGMVIDSLAPRKIAAWKNVLAVGLTGPALLGREIMDAQGGFDWTRFTGLSSEAMYNFTQIPLSKLDGGDLICYGLALSLFYILNRDRSSLASNITTDKNPPSLPVIST